ncbi:hypothetical protein M9H77_02652 [Catharanthus roseus]|uniref:Uncharacterized protein n=1 Tax=Catharanthus roseus TaxID=4058 RepID=A0ACC0C901_CATRO|nr:hypothetical protein M9H77_02652 [Catharanthus roseus]
MRGSNAAGKSEQIKTHQRSLYTRIQKNMLQIPMAPTRSALGPTLVSSPSWLSTRLIGPQPLQSMPLFKWIHSPESETSTPSEEALVRETSHIQCNPLTLPNI